MTQAELEEWAYKRFIAGGTAELAPVGLQGLVPTAQIPAAAAAPTPAASGPPASPPGEGSAAAPVNGPPATRAVPPPSPTAPPPTSTRLGQVASGVRTRLNGHEGPAPRILTRR
jgi:hypothetical protein